MGLPAKAREKLATNPVEFIKQQLGEFVRTSPDNRLPFIRDYVMWDEPLIGFADGDDPIFTEYKTIIAPEHLTPREALAGAYGKSTEDMPVRLSVISWILPAVEETRKSNRLQVSAPSRLWSHTRWYGEKFNEKMRVHVVALLSSAGYLATAPFSQPYFKTYTNEKGPYSNWSERHVAYAAGLGTFSLSDGLITERGIAHRCGNVVTSLVLPKSPRTADGPYSNCLFYAGASCRACIERCPAGAITEKGHDKNRCQRYLHEIGYTLESLTKEGYNNEKSVVGCGLCQTKVPCEFENPTNKLKKSLNKG
ncbi:epoxyqueuosine reductase [Chloroflexota bacterium]